MAWVSAPPFLYLFAGAERASFDWRRDVCENGRVSVESSSPRSYRDLALVLRHQQLGETDRIIIFLTRQQGLVHAVAKGVRKSSSKFGGRLEPFMLVDVSLVAGKNLHTVSQVQTRRAYTAPLMADFDAYSVALVLAELTESLLRFTSELEQGFFDLVTGAVSALSRRLHHPLDVFLAFALRAMQLAGWEFNTDFCTLCSEPLVSAWYSAETALICEDCARISQIPLQHRVSSQVLEYLRLLFAGQWEEVESVEHRVERTDAFRLVSHYVQWQLEKPIKSLSLIEKEA